MPLSVNRQVPRPNIAPSLGPILGGVLADLTGWRWIFWFLAIFSGAVLCLILAFLPETARTVVGRGELPAKSMSFQTIRLPKIQKLSRLHVPNPFKALKIIAEKDSATIIFINGVFYMTYCCVQTSLSSLFIDLYHLTELQSGLIYLPFGFGCAIGSYTFGTRSSQASRLLRAKINNDLGRIMNRDYKVIAKAAGLEVNKSTGDDLSKLHIEAARLRSAWWIIGVALACILGYGWTLHAKTVR